MEVELVRWPREQAHLDDVRRRGAARLILVEDGTSPPLLPDDLEDWVRLPASDEDIRLRIRVLSERAADPGGGVPVIDDSGVLRFRRRWTALPPVEQRLTTALVDRFGAVVGREALARAGWPAGIPDRNVLDVHIVRLRRRLLPLGLVIRTVRSRGYLLEREWVGTMPGHEPSRAGPRPT